jgi:hypothetical protein
VTGTRGRVRRDKCPDKMVVCDTKRSIEIAKRTAEKNTADAVIKLNGANDLFSQKEKRANSSDKFGHGNYVILRESCKLPDLHFLS